MNLKKVLHKKYNKMLKLLLIILCSQYISAFLWEDPKQNCTLVPPDSENYCYSPPGPMIDLDSIFQWSSCGIPGTLALTFDDGPSVYTDHILDVLKQYNMKATFFLIGRNIVGNTATVQRMVNEGHQIGSHTQDHLDLTTLTSDQVVFQIVQWEHTLIGLNFSGPLAGGVIPNYFRSPHGEMNQNVSDILTSYGYTIMNWGFNSEDASGENLSPEELYEVYVSHLGDGSLINTATLSLIIQQHDSIENTSIIFETVADYLNQTLFSNGVRLVTLSECMGFNIPSYRPNPRPQNDPSCQNGIQGTGTGKLACCLTSCGVCGGENCSINLGGGI
jgi:peptidoglycan/xylan/chitin deacetylase (PgdA/CDA1 family)